MRFRSEIEPVLSSMERELQNIEDRLSHKEKEWEKKFELIETMRMNVERKMKNNLTEVDKIKRAYKDKDEILKEKEKQFALDSRNLAEARLELIKKRKEIDKELEITQLTRKAAEREREKQADITKKTETKLAILHQDAGSLENRNIKLNEKENDLRTKENMLFNREQVLAEKDRELKIREIKLKGKEEKVEQEYIKYKLGEK